MSENNGLNVIICGVVKNAQQQLCNNIETAIQLGKKCDQYKIVIYENNSTDSTKIILETFRDNEHFNIIMEDIDEETIKRESKIWAYTKVTGSDHPCRIEQISNARNKLVSEFEKDIYNNYNYVVMIDFDSKLFMIDGILNSLDLVRENKKRIIYANSPNYYDYYALRSKHSEYNLFGPELTGEFFWQKMKVKPLELNHQSKKLCSVYSAFNGIGVYDKNVFKNHRYDALISNKVKEMYKTIMSQNTDIYNEFRTLISNDCPKFVHGERDETTGFVWKNNSGYNKPVICEHVSFNFSALNDGYEIFINPAMLYWW